MMCSGPWLWTGTDPVDPDHRSLAFDKAPTPRIATSTIFCTTLRRSTTLDERIRKKKNFSSPRTSISCLHWFPWLIGQAPDFDLVCIAGDLLDMFASETRLEQAREVARLIRELADIFPSPFAPAIMTMLADSSRMIGHRFMNGSSCSEPIGTSSPMDQRESWRT
jgi:hypothetical protein